MGRTAAALLARSAIFLFALLSSGQMAILVKAQTPTTITSGWMTQPIIVDGKITKAEEWSDTVPVDLAPDSPATSVSARIWIKNDLKHICILAATKWPAREYDEQDAFCIEFRSIWTEQLDVVVGGYTIDWNRVNGTRIDDTKMRPPGRNDVEGGASHNGTHYWFELRRKLDTGDPYDLVLVPGRAFRDVRVNFYDRSVKKGVGDWRFVLLLAPVLPSVELVKPEDQTATKASEVRFTASVLGHLSKVTLLIEGKDREMKLNQAGLYEASLTLADGLYKWRVNALGVLGNVTSIPERSLTVDTTKPAVTIRSPTAGEVIRKSEVLVSWEAWDATSGIAKVEVKVDASDWVDVTGKTSHTFTWVVEGNHEVRVRAADRAGNVAEQVITFTTSPPPWYATYWYVPLGAVAAVVAIAAVMKSRGRPPKPAKPPEVKPLKIERPPKPPTREELLKELEELHRSGRIAETAYRRLKKKYEAKAN